MLGRQHFAISTAFILPFIVPFLFESETDFVLVAVFIVFVGIGSLLPDSDSAGHASIYYKHRFIDSLMTLLVIRTTIAFLSLFISKENISDKHRGIMHTPVGVFVGSFVLSFILDVLVTVVFLIIGYFNWWILLFVFLGLIIGQLLHLIEDSCTVTGIDWGSPLGSFKINGNISTYSHKKKIRDKRPLIFTSIFNVLLMITLLLSVFDVMTMVALFVFITLSSLAGLIAMIVISNTKKELWIEKK